MPFQYTRIGNFGLVLDVPAFSDFSERSQVGFINLLKINVKWRVTQSRPHIADLVANYRSGNFSKSRPISRRHACLQSLAKASNRSYSHPRS